MNRKPDDLDEALRLHGGAPDHLPDFAERLSAGLDEADREIGRTPAGRLHLPHMPHAVWRRHRILAGAAVAAVAAAVAVAVLFGVPGAGDRTGPPPVSAAVVVQSAQRALASAGTLVADCTSSRWNLAHWDTPDSVPVRGRYHVVARSRLVLRDDGSYRQTLEPLTLEEARRLAQAGTSVYALEDDTAYDASTGVRHSYYRGSATWAGDFSTDAVATSAQVLTGCAPGQPDFWLTRPEKGTTFDFGVGGFMRALPAVAGGDVRSSTYQGRPVWIVTAQLPLLWEMWESAGTRSWSLKGPALDRLAVTVDRQTSLPLRTQAWYKGVLFSESRLDDVRVGVDLPSDAFTVDFPVGTKVSRRDMGFRSLTLDGAAARVGHGVLVPKEVPAGSALSQVAVAPRAESRKWSSAPQGTDIVSLRYQRGFDAVTVTTRRVEHPRQFEKTDAFGYDYGMPGSGSFSVPQGGYVAGPTVVRLTAGALAGARARLVTGPLVTPHLWAWKGHVLLTISGAATQDELVAMANSMRTYPDSRAGD